MEYSTAYLDRVILIVDTPYKTSADASSLGYAAKDRIEALEQLDDSLANT